MVKEGFPVSAQRLRSGEEVAAGYAEPGPLGHVARVLGQDTEAL